MLDGKIVNQYHRHIEGRYKCGCCGKKMEDPDDVFIKLSGSYYDCKMYNPQSPYFIYETKRGNSVVYCSDECRKKHNHRFRYMQPTKPKRPQKIDAITEFWNKLANEQMDLTNEFGEIFDDYDDLLLK